MCEIRWFSEIVWCIWCNLLFSQVYSGSNDRNLLIWTPDHKVEDAYTHYLDDIVAQQNKPQASTASNTSTARPATNGEMSAEPTAPQTQTMSAVLADTWSDSEDDDGW